MTPRVIEEITPRYGVKLALRLASRAEEDRATGCWLWTGRLDQHGYGKIKVNNIHTGTHRAAWLAYRGDIPSGLVVDHLCRNRACLNPWHLELVTVRVNTRRGALKGVVGKWPRGSFCIRGHAYSEHSVERQHGGYTRRICLACERIRTRAHKARIRAAG